MPRQVCRRRAGRGLDSQSDADLTLNRVIERNRRPIGLPIGLATCSRCSRCLASGLSWVADPLAVGWLRRPAPPLGRSLPTDPTPSALGFVKDYRVWLLHASATLTTWLCKVGGDQGVREAQGYYVLIQSDGGWWRGGVCYVVLQDGSSVTTWCCKIKRCGWSGGRVADIGYYTFLLQLGCVDTKRPTGR